MQAVGDIVVGSVLGPSSQRANEARIAMFLAGFPETVPVRTVNRCSSRARLACRQAREPSATSSPVRSIFAGSSRLCYGQRVCCWCIHSPLYACECVRKNSSDDVHFGDVIVAYGRPWLLSWLLDGGSVCHTD